MHHEDDLQVYLEVEDDEVQEFAYPDGQSPNGGDVNVTRGIISTEAGKHLTVVFETGHDFRMFAAQGLKLTIAIGHTQQKPGALDDNRSA